MILYSHKSYFKFSDFLLSGVSSKTLMLVKLTYVKHIWAGLHWRIESWVSVFVSLSY